LIKIGEIYDMSFENLFSFSQLIFFVKEDFLLEPRAEAKEIVNDLNITVKYVEL
jgi:hypothetical protein